MQAKQRLRLSFMIWPKSIIQMHCRANQMPVRKTNSRKLQPPTISCLTIISRKITMRQGIHISSNKINKTNKRVVQIIVGQTEPVLTITIKLRHRRHKNMIRKRGASPKTIKADRLLIMVVKQIAILIISNSKNSHSHLIK